MNTGAVALIDALGFRGIWNRHNSDEVLSELKDMKEWMENRVKTQFESQPMQCEVAFLSDTIAISMALDPQLVNKDAISILYLCDVVSWVLERSLRSKIPLAYRGAIALGSYHVSPHFLIGQAVDDAANSFDLAQGAFIWLTPLARERVLHWLLPQTNNTHLVKYSVPLKTGDTFQTYTVSPLEQARDKEDANQMTRTLFSTFVGSSMDVAVKRQNTMAHMRACYAGRNLEYPQEFANAYA
jgi:hypothetical protein